MANDPSVIVNVDFGTASVTTQGFGTVLVAGPATFSERIRRYSSAAEAAADSGVMTASQLDAVTLAFSQSPKPAEVAVGKILSNVAQVNTVTVTSAVDAAEYTVTINETDFTHTATTGQTAAQIASALNTLINAGAEPVGSTVSTATLTLTADVAGVAFTVGVVTNMSTASVTANRNQATELAVVLDADSDWYAVVIDSNTKKDILDVFAWAVANKKFFAALTSDSDILSETSGNVAEQLEELSYKQGVLLYYSDTSTRADAAWAARQMAVDLDINSNTWDKAPLVGVPADTLTTSQRSVLDNYNANYVVDFYGTTTAQSGITPSGHFADKVITKDWFAQRLAEAYAAFVLSYTLQGKKIPFTNQGIQLSEGVARKVVRVGETANHFRAGEAVFDFPDLSEVSDADRNARTLNASVEVPLAGAIHKFNITGTLL